jgi:hypothetical protein
MRKIQKMLPAGCVLLRSERLGEDVLCMAQLSNRFAVFAVSSNAVISPALEITGQKALRVAPLRKVMPESFFTWVEDAGAAKQIWWDATTEDAFSEPDNVIYLDSRKKPRTEGQLSC